MNNNHVFYVDVKDGTTHGTHVTTGVKFPRDLSDEPPNKWFPKLYTRSQRDEERDDYHNDSQC